MANSIKNLVFEGGGVKGLAYVGALKILEERGILKGLERVAGTSAGAITACLLGVGYTVTEIENLLRDLDFNKFKDGSTFMIGDIYRLLSKYGLYKGDYFTNWALTVIRNKTGLTNPTFAQLHQYNLTQKTAKTYDLYLMATNLSTKYGVLFSHEHTPDVPVAKALRMSMSIPLFFTAVEHGRPTQIYVDGGVLNNYPIQIFDKGQEKNPQTLGLRLDTREEIDVLRHGLSPKIRKIDSFSEYLEALVLTLMAAQENRHLDSGDWNRTIYIDTLKIQTTQFDLSKKDKDDLVMAGLWGADTYFKWLDGEKKKQNVA